MPKLTDKQLQSRKLELAAKSRAAVVKKELVQFRLEADKIVKLFEIAAKSEMQMGTMLRQWVKERIAYEESKLDKGRKQESRGISAEFVVKEPTTDIFASDSLERKVNLLEQRMARLEVKLKSRER